MINRDISNILRQELEKGKLRKEEFPQLSDYGVVDYSETVHSTGLNYITAIGRSIANIIAVSELPIYPNKFPFDIRSDSVWLNKQNENPVLICEFERFENNRSKKRKLKEKIENLLIAYHQFDNTPDIILFVYWSYNQVSPGDLSEYINIFDNGFTRASTFFPAIDTKKTEYIIYHALASGSKENLVLNQWIKIR